MESIFSVSSFFLVQKARFLLLPPCQRADHVRGQVAKVNESAHCDWRSYSLYLDRGKRLAVLDFAGTVLLQTDSLNSNEAARVLYHIVSLVCLNARFQKATYHWGKALEGVHGRLSLGVKVGGLAGTSDNECAALVGEHVDLALNVPLAEDDGVVKEFTLWAEVHAIVQTGGPVRGDHLVTDGTDLGVHDKALKISVSGAQDRQAGGVVTATALQTNEP